MVHVKVDHSVERHMSRALGDRLGTHAGNVARLRALFTAARFERGGAVANQLRASDSVQWM